MLTNNYGFPEIMSDAMQPTPYVPCGSSDYSATSLILSPRQVQLEKRHGSEVTEDLMDRWHAWLGDAVHSALESRLKLNPKYLVERKITRFDLGRRVVAKFDAYDTETKTLYDHKKTTTYIHGLEGAKKEWIEQLNINAYFLRKEGHEVNAIKIHALYLDWKERQAFMDTDGKYPRLPVAVIDIPLWDVEKQEEFYLDRLRKHIAAEAFADEDLPLCTSEECWEKETKYAVQKKGADRAKKLCSSREEAQQYITHNKLSGFDIMFRPGERTKCEKYCTKASPFCTQYLEYKSRGE